jgi:GT2 family glycosyltransferase
MTDQYSLIDYGPNEKEIDRVIGGSLGINTRQMGKEAYFDKNLGRRNGKLLGGIDSEFCERAIKKGFKVYYCGCTIAQHQILESRMTLSWSINKFYYSGYSRAIRGGRPSSMNKKREIVDCLVLGLFAIFYITGLFVGSLNRQNMEKP